MRLLVLPMWYCEFAAGLQGRVLRVPLVSIPKQAGAAAAVAGALSWLNITPNTGTCVHLDLTRQQATRPGDSPAGPFPGLAAGRMC